MNAATDLSIVVMESSALILDYASVLQPPCIMIPQMKTMMTSEDGKSGTRKILSTFQGNR